MNLADTEQKSASGAVVASTANTRLSGSWLIVARTVWLVLAISSLGLFIAIRLVSYQHMLSVCVDPVTCTNLAGVLPAKGLQALTSSGFSVSEHAALLTIFFAITAAIWYAVGFLIFWRRSDDWLALLAAFVLVMFNVTSLGNTASALALAYPILALPLNLVDFLGQVSLSVFFLLFPNGRLVPRWMGLILLLSISYTFLTIFPSITSPFNAHWPAWLNWLVILVVFGAIIYSQIYRYRRVSTPVQRQQTKWVALGVTAAIGVAIGILALSSLFPSSAVILFINIWPVAFLLIPLSIGFAILRFRLYDIDIIIHRTLVYSTLTVVLAVIYEVSVFTLQSFTSGLTLIRGNQLAIVASTFLIAALFQPLRRRIQAIIVRRFFRRKYDAAKTVEAFSATLRNEVDLNQLREQLLAVVQETMQPAHVSLWLRQPER